MIFNRSRAPRVLHSFPTRRSSDLTTFWEHPWPTTVIRCRRAVNPPEHHQRRTAERLKAEYHELDTGHYPMLSEPEALTRDRKSTRLNSSHTVISYAVFCLKKKKTT